MNLKSILKKISLIDWIIYLLFPIIISLVYLWGNIYFPNPATNLLFLNLSNPQWWQFITMNFVHFTFSHFIINLFAYLLFGLVILLILKQHHLKRNPFLFIFISLVIFSIITGVISILIYKNGMAGGSSGITAAMFMFLVVVVYFNNKQTPRKISLKASTMKLVSWAIFTIIGFYLLFSKNSGVNHLGHLIGVIWGLIIALIFLKQHNIKNRRQ